MSVYSAWIGRIALRPWFGGMLMAFLLICYPWFASGTNHLLRQDELMAGLNGDATVQFLEIKVSGSDQKNWGPPSPGLPSRAMLVFFDGSGVEVGRFFFPSDAPFGEDNVLIATEAFAALPGAPTVDFIIPPLMTPGSGKVCFRGNPSSPGSFDVNLCLSYGDFPEGETEGAGVPAPALPMTGDPTSLTRFQNFAFGVNSARNEDFTLASPTPRNTLGETMIFPVSGPEIDLIPTILQLGLRDMNTGPGNAQSVIVTNRGGVNSLTISNVTLAGPNFDQFQIVAGGPTNVGPVSAQPITVAFNPTSPGRKNAILRITSDDPDEPVVEASLQGVGVDPNAPEIEVQPAPVRFGDHPIAGGVSSKSILISNEGEIGSLTISNISLTGSNANEFSITSPTNSSVLPPGGSRGLDLRFDPTSPGPKNATLTIVSDDLDEGILEVPLHGRGFDLQPCTAPNPAHSVPQNDCDDAQLICPGTIFEGTLVGASADGSSLCGPGIAPDVWGRYVPVKNGTLIVSLRSTGVGSLTIHSGCPGTIGNQVACANVPIQAPLEGPNVRLSLPVSRGEELFVRLTGPASENVTFQLFLEGPPCVEFDQNANGTTDTCESDFGDAPAPYPTTLDVDGARHRAFTGLFLGTKIDPEDDGQPSPLASGDNLDGDINDDDGIALGSPLIVGSSASVRVRASGPGILNGWIDFNADGDWSDSGEQVFTNASLVTGTNTLTLTVPGDAAATNMTFARYRFSSLPGLGVTGPAEDGEVEDYAVEILPVSAVPSSFSVRINEVMAGLNGDSTVQFVEIEPGNAESRRWGPQGAETTGRAMLLFFDSAGKQSGRFVFPADAPAIGQAVLVATHAFAEQTGLIPDFLMPPEVVPVGGKVVFASNPDNKHFDVHVALSYGGSEYFGMTDGAGAPNTNSLPILHAKSLTRVEEFPFGLNFNNGFTLSTPTPTTSSGQTVTLSGTNVAQQGRTLFTRETFRGNGRTCATCHVPGRDQFGLTPATIDQLGENDPLFVFEHNINLVKLVSPSQPSDLRGTITNGETVVVSGSGDTYLIIGGESLSGAIGDTNGNSGTIASVTAGNLHGPNPINGSPRGLEDHALLAHGRGLILENIDGFRKREVFRASPHLLTLALTAPYGLSGEFETLEEFSAGAVVQHFTKSLHRISGVDFRTPTEEELSAMREFMVGISNPSTNTLNLDRLATTEAQKRGRALFFGDEGRCAKCHSGPALSFSDGSLTGSIPGVNENFNTGVANILKNLAAGDNLPTEPPGLTPGQSTREFNTPGLFGVRLTGPYFHDGSAKTLEEAVKFYDTEQFHNSPAGDEVGSLLAANKPELIADVVAFLESLVQLPVLFPHEIDFGVHCPEQPARGSRLVVITNLSASTITITNFVINGTNAAEFSIVGDSGETTLGPGQMRQFELTFTPATLGRKRATFEVTAVDTNLLGTFSFGVALTGADLDSFVHATPLAFDFGMRDIDAPPSPEESIVISNTGSIPLDVLIELTGTNAFDFTMLTETNAIPPGGTRVIQLTFAPQSQGIKTATVRIQMLSCTGTLIEIPLAGIATSTVSHLAWGPLGTTQLVGRPIPVRITAQDRNGDTVKNFRGTARLFLEPPPDSEPNPILPARTDPFVDGVWNGFVTLRSPGFFQLMAIDNPGHSGHSTALLAIIGDDLVLTVTDAPDPLFEGQPITYTMRVRNTGIEAATNVVLTQRLPAGVSLLSAHSSQGTLSNAAGIVTAALGDLPPASTSIVSVVVQPNTPPSASVLLTNVATVTRVGPEFFLANNTVTNTTRVHSFGVLSVTPGDVLSFSGFSGGPFAPLEHVYTLSNSGTAALTWEIGAHDCQPPAEMRSWWRFEADAANAVGTNSGLVMGATFTNGFIGQGLRFDGSNDAVHIPASPLLDVGPGLGFTVEGWINPDDVSESRPILEWIGGVQFWMGSSNGPGSLYADLLETEGTNRHPITSSAGLLQSNTWQHVALTYNRDSGRAVLYLNGEAVADQAVGNLVPLTSSDVFIGGRANLLSFAGSIDELGIYETTLSSAEIEAIFLAGTDGKCRLPGWLAISNFTGALAAGSMTNVSVSINTNGNVLETGNYAGTILFTNLSNGRGTVEGELQLAILNRPPTLGALASIEVPEDSGLISVTLSNITAGGNELQNLNVQAFSGNTNVVPNPLPLDYTNPAANGILHITPSPDAYGAAEIMVVVTDDGSTANGEVNAVTNSFVLTVTPVNDPPSIIATSNEAIPELTSFALTNLATDIDGPNDVLFFSLEAPPAGCTINETTGVLTWTPNEDQGPGIYEIRVIVADNGAPPLSATNHFTISVGEVNSPPALMTVASQTVHEGATVLLTAAASDPDFPTNNLIYSLVPHTTAATITPSGSFRWVATNTVAPGTNDFAITVTDQGNPPLADTKPFQIVVMNRPALSITRSNAAVTLRWNSIPGTGYRMQVKAAIESEWVELPQDIIATEAVTTMSESLQDNRFYQLRVLP